MTRRRSEPRLDLIVPPGVTRTGRLRYGSQDGGRTDRAVRYYLTLVFDWMARSLR